MELNEKLLALRKARNMTQDELAEALFVSRQSVYKWETGRAVPDVHKLKQLCVFFGVSADELLELTPEASAAAHEASAPLEAPATPEAPASSPAPAKRGRGKRIMLCVGAAVLAVALIIALLLPPSEVLEAVGAGIVPMGMALTGGDVSERDMYALICGAAKKETGTVPARLEAALKAATNERLTREKAAYLLYSSHILIKLDADADVAISMREAPDPITQRDVYKDLNAASRQRADETGEAPWDASLCEELDEVGAIFSNYDGTRETDERIDSILSGIYYTSVTFCAAQHSYISQKPVMECQNASFRPKDRITREEAIIAVYRLFGSW